MSKKLKHWLLFFGACILMFPARAQDPGKQEQIKTLKIAFFTERLNLSPEEATVFWPIYNAHEKAKQALRDQERQEIRDRFSNLDEISEVEAQKALRRYLEIEEQEEELDKEFYQRIAREFSAVRTLKLFEAERDFRRRLLQEYRKRGRNRP
jgi:hypothetical protein